MLRSAFMRSLAVTAVLLSAGCLHPGTQERGPLPGRDDFSVAPPPPPPVPEPVVRQPPAFRLWHLPLRGVSSYVVRVALADVRPEIVFPGGGSRPQDGAASFEALLRRTGGGIASSGAFFGERSHRILGTLISGGRVCQTRTWDRRGTALEIDASNMAFLRTLRVQKTLGHCPFFMQAGPRLVLGKKIWLHPRLEGFSDPVLLGRARRVGLGLEHHGRVLLLVAFTRAITLRTEAEGMRDLGCTDAMNLDGGSSAALAIGGRVLVQPTTLLTHVLAFEPIATTRGRLPSATRRPPGAPRG